jgi:hypothetical protein
MRRLLLCAVLCLLACGCAEELVQGECPGLLVNGTCCEDANNDSICDIEDVVPVKKAPPPAPVVQDDNQPLEQPLSIIERERLVRAVAENVTKLRERKDWNALYDLLVEEDKTMTLPEFRFFMDIAEYQQRVRNDPSVSYIMENWSYVQTRGTELSFLEVVREDDEAYFSYGVTIGGVYYGEDLMELVWVEGWKLKNPALGDAVDAVCSGLAYPSLCYYEHAKALKQVSSCPKSGEYFVECYQALDKVVPVNVAFDICGAKTMTSANDDCLADAAAKTHQTELCEGIVYDHFRYRCLGLIAGLEGELEDCFALVNETGRKKQYYEGMCIFGYAEGIGDVKPCFDISRQEEDLRKDCFALK